VQISGSFALRADGTIWSWTKGARGALEVVRIDAGEGPFLEVASPAGTENVCARRIDGSLWCSSFWCRTPASRSTATASIGSRRLGFDVVEIEEHCARKLDGSVWCWGEGRGRRLAGSALGSEARELAAGGEDHGRRVRPLRPPRRPRDRLLGAT
jgi:hypothetical protein